MNVDLHIDALALDGLPLTAWQGALVQAAVARELTRLLGQSAPGAWGTGGESLASVQGGAIRVAPGGDAAGLGLQIATAVHGGLGGPR